MGWFRFVGLATLLSMSRESSSKGGKERLAYEIRKLLVRRGGVICREGRGMDGRGDGDWKLTDGSFRGGGTRDSECPGAACGVRKPWQGKRL